MYLLLSRPKQQDKKEKSHEVYYKNNFSSGNLITISQKGFSIPQINFFSRLPIFANFWCTIHKNEKREKSKSYFQIR